MNRRQVLMITATVLGSTLAATAASSIQHKPFGTFEDKEVRLYTLTNAKGMRMSVMNYGGIITSLTSPDRKGVMADIVLGYDDLDSYLKSSPYFGAIVGRYGNRIAHGKFTLDGHEYTLATNNGANHLHGGVRGFDKVYWNITEQKRKGAVGLQLTYVSPDGEEGYPGTLSCTVNYWLTDKNTLEIDYRATTDKTTIVNLTQHSYFNLSGNIIDNILDHEVTLNADHFLPVDSGLIPTGVLEKVKGTPMDFTTPCAIGKRVNDDHEQLKLGLGYDHAWVLNQKKPGELTLAARVSEPESGRILEMHTTEPAIQFYSGNFLDGSNIGKGGVVYNYRYGIALEPEHFPDSPNKPSFPSVVLKPGETYSTRTVYTFSAR